MKRRRLNLVLLAQAVCYVLADFIVSSNGAEVPHWAHVCAGMILAVQNFYHSHETESIPIDGKGISK